MSNAHQVNVEFKPCTSVIDYFFVRALRNKNYHFMTNNANRISIVEQLKFMLTKPPQIELYVARVGSRRVAYLLLNRNAPNTAYITEAVDERWRRCGIGEAIIDFAKSKVDNIIAQIKASNVASIKLHQHCGFRLLQDGQEVVTYVFP